MTKQTENMKKEMTLDQTCKAMTAMKKWAIDNHQFGQFLKAIGSVVLVPLEHPHLYFGHDDNYRRVAKTFRNYMLSR